MTIPSNNHRVGVDEDVGHDDDDDDHGVDERNASDFDNFRWPGPERSSPGISISL